MTPSGFLQKSKPINCQWNLKYWRNWKDSLCPSSSLNKTNSWVHFIVKVLSLLPLLSSRMSKIVGTKSKRWFSMWLYFVFCVYTIQIHIRWKNLPGLPEPNKWKGCVWPKSTEFSETAPEICQVWEWKPQSISPFPLADRLLQKNRRGFPANILSVRGKKTIMN